MNKKCTGKKCTKKKKMNENMRKTLSFNVINYFLVVDVYLIYF